MSTPFSVKVMFDNPASRKMVNKRRLMTLMCLSVEAPRSVLGAGRAGSGREAYSIPRTVRMDASDEFPSIEKGQFLAVLMLLLLDMISVQPMANTRSYFGVMLFDIIEVVSSETMSNDRAPLTLPFGQPFAMAS